MGFLDIFSGKQARQTAMANSALAQQTFGNLNTMLAQNRDQSQQYITNANEAVQNRYNAAKPELLGTLTGSLDQARGALAGGYNQARTDVTGGYNQARTDLSGGYDAARGTLNQATGLMQPYIAAGAGADKLYGGAIGLGGQEGGDLARRSFQEAPGTEYQIRRASEEAARKAGSLGMAASGDTLNAVAGQAQQRANAGWGRLARPPQGRRRSRLQRLDRPGQPLRRDRRHPGQGGAAARPVRQHLRHPAWQLRHRLRHRRSEPGGTGRTRPGERHRGPPARAVGGGPVDRDPARQHPAVHGELGRQPRDPAPRHPDRPGRQGPGGRRRRCRQPVRGDHGRPQGSGRDRHGTDRRRAWGRRGRAVPVQPGHEQDRLCIRVSLERI
jgi:hypothetical protein